MTQKLTSSCHALPRSSFEPLIRRTIYQAAPPGDEVDSMAAVAKAYAERSLQGFQTALDAHREQLAGDPVVHTHLQVCILVQVLQV